MRAAARKAGDAHGANRRRPPAAKAAATRAATRGVRRARTRERSLTDEEVDRGAPPRPHPRPGRVPPRCGRRYLDWTTPRRAPGVVRSSLVEEPIRAGQVVRT